MEEIFICPFCGRNDFRNKRSYVKHIKYCKNNPDRVDGPNKGKKFTDEHKQMLSASHKGKKLSDEAKQKVSESLKKRYENETTEQKQERIKTQQQAHNTPEVKQKQSEASKIFANNPEVRQKEYETKKKNNSFNTSKIETELKNYFDSNNIEYISQYRSELYPFCCDFYFPDSDLYVEIQGSWTHGGKPYIETDPDCITQLETWKSKNTKFYDKAIETWTVRDVNKRNVAKTNNLNWIEIFSIDLDECIQKISEQISIYICK